MILVYSMATFCALATAIHLSTVVIAIWRCRRGGRPSPSSQSGGVTLLRPVCGVEPFAYETLQSSFRLRHPDYEIAFCAARADDPVVDIVRRLIAEHQNAPAHLLIGDDHICVNPKLNNLVKGWAATQQPWVVMADSNVLLPTDAIEQLIAAWRADTGAVCSMPIASRPKNFWAEVECAFLNTLQARFQFVSEAFGFGFAQGKVMLLRRDLIEIAGGIGALAIDTAEDAATTKIVRAAGLRVQLVDRPFVQPLGRRAGPGVWSRQLRWARLRRASFPCLFAPEIFMGSVLPTAALAVAAARCGISVPESILALLLVWFGAEWVLARTLGWYWSLRMPFALALRDLMLPVLFIAALTGSEFIWRGTPVRTVSNNHLSAPADLLA